MRVRLLALLALALGVAGCFDPIVGARCADGYVPCHGRCVAVCGDDGGAQGDGPDGRAGDGGSSTVDGGLDDGGAGDGALPGDSDGATNDDGAGHGDGGTAGDGGSVSDGGGSLGDGKGSTDANLGDGGGAIGDGGAPGTDGPSSGASDAPLGPDAGLASDAPMADASIDDAASADGTSADASVIDTSSADGLPADASPAVDAPPPVNCGALTLCPTGCVNLQSDPDNCGQCQFSCGTGLCVNGTCQLRPSGHLVVIGHDYAVSRPSMDSLVGNAVFMTGGAAVKVLAYQGAASQQEINGTDQAINRVAASTGRTWVKTVASAADVPTALAFADVFVIYAQSGATDGQLLALGNNWATELSDFVQAGKTIVVLEGFYANNGTYQIVQQANLFHATGRMEATGDTMLVARAGDAVAARVPQTYRGERSTVWFATMDQTVVVQVVTDAGTQPVVIHLVL